MRIKSLIIEDENGKQYAFTHRSVVAVEEYDPAKDPEVQGKGLHEIYRAGDGNLYSINGDSVTVIATPKVEPLKAKRKYTKK